jgi:peptidoglycan/xylan/chitin deacetylase (PgdA/CDA1 family)
MIKSVMYHYVRPVENSSLRYLSLDDFKNQLDWLYETVGHFVTSDEWEQAKLGRDVKGVLLTFDDGLKDHIDYVLPVLKEKGLFAIFFVSSSPLVDQKMLAVHLTHKLLSLSQSNEILGFLEQHIPKKIWSKLNTGPAAKAYSKHRDLETNVIIKKFVNYLFTDFDLKPVLELVSQKFISSSLEELAKSWYMTKKDIQDLSFSGMKIGSHANTHRLLSILNDDDIYHELSESKIVLEGALESEVNEFCYPYGGAHSYSEVVKEFLAELNYSVSHDVAPRDITRKDFESRFSLPRFNCNELPFGIAHSLKS